MKKIRKMTKLQIVVTISIWIVMMMVSSVGILAYQEEEVFHVKEYDSIADKDAVLCEYPVGMIPSEEGHFPKIQLVEGYEYYFIYEDGTTEPMYENEIIEKASCSHNYESKSYTKHIKNGSGGCTFTVYIGDVCTKCRNKINEEEQYSTTYKKCPH